MTHDKTRCPMCGTYLDREKVLPFCDVKDCRDGNGFRRFGQIAHEGKFYCGAHAPRVPIARSIARAIRGTA